MALVLLNRQAGGGRAAALTQGRHLGHPQVRTRAFRSLQLHADEPLPLAADGEGLQASARVQVRLWPAALQVVGLTSGPR